STCVASSSAGSCPRATDPGRRHGGRRTRHPWPVRGGSRVSLPDGPGAILGPDSDGGSSMNADAGNPVAERPAGEGHYAVEAILTDEEFDLFREVAHLRRVEPGEVLFRRG